MPQLSPIIGSLFFIAICLIIFVSLVNFEPKLKIKESKISQSSFKNNYFNFEGGRFNAKALRAFYTF